VLESLVEHFEDETVQVKMALLTSAMRLFFKRPPEMQNILGTVISKAINLQENPDLHDRALLYYRLLRHDVREAAKIVNTPTNSITSFAEDESFDVIERIFQEFDSLSVVYGKPSEAFIKKRPLKPASFTEKHAVNDSRQRQNSYDKIANGGSGHLRLNSQVSIDPNYFQELWGSIEPSAEFQLITRGIVSEQSVADVLVTHGVVRLASGKVDGVIKVYLYAKEETSGELLLMEVLGNTETAQLSATIKSNAPFDVVSQFAEECKQWLA